MAELWETWCWGNDSPRLGCFCEDGFVGCTGEEEADRRAAQLCDKSCGQRRRQDC